MTIAIVPKTPIYEIDYLLWIQETVDKLKAKDFDHLDIENLIEEIESLGISQKKEVRNRLRVLLEHLVKRMYVDMPDCFEGWENTIRTQRNDFKDELVDMPSLKRFWDEFFDRAWQRALLDVHGEYSKKGYQFPDTWQFNRDLDSMLNVDFWLF